MNSAQDSYIFLGSCKRALAASIPARCLARLHPSYPWQELARIFQSRFDEEGDLLDLTRTIVLLSEAVPLVQAGDVRRVELLETLGEAHRARFSMTGANGDIDFAVELHMIAAKLRDPVRPARARFLHGIADDLSSRFERTGQTAYIDRAIELDQAGVSLCPQGHPDRFKSLGQLATHIVVRFEQFGALDDLEKAILLNKEVFALCPPDNVYLRSMAQINLAIAVSARFKQLGRLEDLEEAIRIYRREMDLSEAQHDPSVAGNLAVNLTMRFEHLGSMGDLEEAIQLHRNVIARYSSNRHGYSFSLHSLATALLIRGERLGLASDLSDAVDFHRSGLAARDLDHPNRPLSLSNLASAVLARFRMIGNIADFENGLSLEREALRLLPVGHPERPVTLNNIGIDLVERFEQSGDFASLEEAIQVHREALQLRPPGHPLRSASLDNLGSALAVRYEKLSDRDDLEEAISLRRGSLNLRRTGHPARAASLNNLANALAMRFEWCGSQADFEEAMQLFREAIQRYSPKSHGHSRSLLNLASLYVWKFRFLKDASDAIEARELMIEALSLMALGRVDRPTCLGALARLYLESGTPYEDVNTGLQYFSEAISDEHLNAQLRLTDALRTLKVLRKRTVIEDDRRSAILAAHVLVVRLLPKVAYFGLGIESRLLALKHAESTALDAASHALGLGRMHVALELLEEGRGVFWTQALRLRTQFDDLPRDLRDDLVSLSRQLERGSHISARGEIMSNTAAEKEEAFASRRRQSEKFQNLVEQARSLPGFGRFMMPHDSSLLLKSAGQGPVVILLASRVSCDAIIIKPGGDATHVVLHVTSLRLQELGDITKALAERGRDIATDDRAMIKADPDRSVTGTSQLGFLDVLQELWSDVVYPVVQGLHLKPAAGRQRPRLWWCPTGPFTFLPVHAAQNRVGGHNLCCSDYFVSSYTPTLGALINVRASYRPVNVSDAKVLLAAVPRPYRGSYLPCTIAEIRAAQTSVPPSRLILLPPEDDATRHDSHGASAESIIARLPEASVLHLASHGVQNTGDPLESGFVMRDETLTISRLMTLPLPNAFLAFLSACETAKGDPHQPDQSIHLAATMLFAGFRSVLGTMWSMNDCDGPQVAKAIYERLFQKGVRELDPDTVPYALDDAVRALREEGLPPLRWAPYVHLGM